MQVTTVLLADAAAVADGKLYVHGGGWDRLFTQAFPTTHPSMAVAIQLEVAYTEAQADHRIEVFLVDSDRNRVGPSASGNFNVGHPAIGVHGAPGFVPLALTFPGVSFAEPGTYEWIVEIDGNPLARLPLYVTHIPGGMHLPGVPT